MNRAGIELAASLIVILIAAILMFGLAAGITYKLFCASGDKIDQIDAATQRQLERKLDSGASVQIPDSSKTAESSAGFCGKSAASGAVFTLGVRNDVEDGQFTVTCKSDKLQPDMTEITGADSLCDPSNFQGPGQFEIKETQKVTKLLVLNVPAGAEKGKHVVNIVVNKGGDFYGASNIYLTVQ